MASLGQPGGEHRVGCSIISLVSKFGERNIGMENLCEEVVEMNAIRTLEIPYPADLPAAMGESPEVFEQQLKFLV